MLRRWLAVSIAVGAVALAAGGTLAVTASAQTTGGKHYVALGDSFASGLGAGNYRDATCRQSVDGSYPVQWAQSDDLALNDKSCSGARTDSVRATQLADLNADTDLVSITVGGNDIGFSGSVTQCVLGSESDCHVASQKSIGTMLTTLPGALEGLFTEVANRAPNARVVVTGYPHLVADRPVSCGSLSANKRATLNHGTDVLNDVLRNKATRDRFVFVDVRAAFAGQKACGPNAWVNGVVGGGEAFHPTRDGYAAYSRVIQEAIG